MPEAIRPVDPRITVVMCGYNEAANVPLVLPRLPHDLHEILFIDGNSTDGKIGRAHV